MPPDSSVTSDSDLETVLQDFASRHKRSNSISHKYTCTIAGCDATFKRLDQLDRHEFTHTGIRKHICTYEDCDKAYTIFTHLKRHMRSKHERPITSPKKTIACTVRMCKKMFTSVSNMHRHVRDIHEQPRVYSCEHCSAAFRQKRKLRRHEIVEHAQSHPHKCTKCSRGFYQQWQKERHERSCKVYNCATCNQTFDKWSLYTKHRRETEHERTRSRCKYCECSYEKPSALMQHMMATHPANCASKVPVAFKCKVSGCMRVYRYERNLRQHMRTTHAGRRYGCVGIGCGRIFSSSQNLSKHIEREHGNMPKKMKILHTNLKRKIRKDAGQPVRSRLSDLSSLVLDKEIDKSVRERDPFVLASVAKVLKTQHMTNKDAAVQELLTQTIEDSLL